MYKIKVFFQFFLKSRSYPVHVAFGIPIANGGIHDKIKGNVKEPRQS
jgi:hypothetical protein